MSAAAKEANPDAKSFGDVINVTVKEAAELMLYAHSRKSLTKAERGQERSRINRVRDALEFAFKV